MHKLQRSWVRSQHPSAQWNLRGGRWSSAEYCTTFTVYWPLYAFLYVLTTRLDLPLLIRWWWMRSMSILAIKEPPKKYFEICAYQSWWKLDTKGNVGVGVLLCKCDSSWINEKIGSAKTTCPLLLFNSLWLSVWDFCWGEGSVQGITKRCRLSWMTQ
jgi:hypothetical protein